MASFPTYTVGDFTISPSYCEFDVTYVTTNLPTPQVGAPVSAITQGTGANIKDFDVSYNFRVEPISQTQTTTMTAVSKSKYNPTP